MDEIHRVPELFPTLSGLIDQGRRKGLASGRFLILGSASVESVAKLVDFREFRGTI